MAPAYANEFIDFINEAATVYHAVQYSQNKLDAAGFVRLKEDEVCAPVLHMLLVHQLMQRPTWK